MKTIVTSFVIFVLLTACSPKVVKKTTYTEEKDGTSVTTSYSVDDVEVAKLKKEWKNEYIDAIGSAPLINKYAEDSRNKMLAKKGALLDAQRNLAQKISDIQLTSTTTMSDYSTSDYVQSRINTKLREVEIINERYNKDINTYEVRIQMPKRELINILQEYKKYAY